jgi:hypothetical protein
MTDEERAYAVAEAATERIYETNEGEPCVEEFHQRHDTDSMLILTVHSHYAARKECERLQDQIAGKVVIEIGAGVGFLAMQMAKVAKRVYAIEVDPAWSWIFTRFLYGIKPPNLTWVFGKAEEMIGVLRGDVAVVYTRSDRLNMRTMASQIAPVVIEGPLCSLVEAYPEYGSLNLDAMQELAVGLMTNGDNLTRRGLTGDVLRSAVDKIADTAIATEAYSKPQEAS